MKLESLNNSKYSLTPEKMGELVGGAVNTQCTQNTGGYNLGRIRGEAITADYIIKYTGNDVINNVIEERYNYTGDTDISTRDSKFSNCSCCSGYTFSIN